MEELAEGVFETDEELEGEKYIPNYVCMKKEVPEEEVCESEVSSCSEAKTTTGNILERIITDPLGRRPPCLGKWPSYPPKSESDYADNNHQYRAALQPTTLAQMCSLKITSDPNIFRQPCIVCTIGPSPTNISNIVELLEAGMNIARVSMAHADPRSIYEPIRNIIEANNRFQTMRDYQIPIATMMDLKGQEIRTGKIDRKYKSANQYNGLIVKQNTFVRLTSDKIFEERCTDKIIYQDFPDLALQVERGMIIFISNGEIKLKVESIEKYNILCFVLVGGVLKNNQKIHVPMLVASLPTLSDYDFECLELAAKMDVDVVVVPKTRNEEIIKQVKKSLSKKEQGNDILVFGKISTYEGLESINEILNVADGIILQKNDLCLEISPEKMFIAQKEVIGKCNRVGKPVLCTAQLSSLMSSNDLLRRIEMNDIGGAIVDGADGIILIRETAKGDQAVETTIQLSNIMREAEAATMQTPFYFDLVDEQIPSLEPSKAIALAAVQIANKIQAAAILTVTTSGRTAQLLSWFRPRRPIIAISRVGRTARQMNLWRSVIPLHFSAPVLSDWFHDIKARFEYGISYGKSCGIIASGDLLVLVSGYRKNAGFTNCIRVVFACIDKNEYLENISDYYSHSKSTSLN